MRLKKDLTPSALYNIDKPLWNFQQDQKPLPKTDSDFFDHFYREISSCLDISEFESWIYPFFYQVFAQETCLFYRYTDKFEGGNALVLQRGSYSSENLSEGFYLSLNFSEEEHLELIQLHHHLQENYTQSFFSLNDGELPMTSFGAFRRYSLIAPYGIILHSQQEFLGLILYQKPLIHSYFDSMFRLSLFQSFLSIALDHCLIYNFARLDQLTLLLRKHFFTKELEQKLLSDPQKKFQLIMVDVDYFKAFNDQYGHLEGDRCLRKVAEAISNSIRSRDLASRFGGEEFVCLIDSAEKNLTRVAQRIHKTVAAMDLQVDGLKIPPVTVSIGVTEYQGNVSEAKNDSSAPPQSSASLTGLRLLEEADKALYQAKQMGRNRTAYYCDIASKAAANAAPRL